MATNPMQRQARNSFLLGMVVTLLLAGLIVGFLFMQMKKLNEELEKTKGSMKSVYVLAKDVKSGQPLTEDVFTMKKVTNSGIPVGATSDISTLLSTYSLCDLEGNNIYTDDEGLYMQKDGSRINVYQEEKTDKYYTQNNGQKTYVETTQKPLIAKVDMKANTVITSSLISRYDEIPSSDVRQQEYNSIVLPTDLVDGEYVDIRFMLPTGQDFIVVSKKLATIPVVDGEYSINTIFMNLSEDEILAMSSATVEAYKMDGSKLYATKYVEAGLQDAATPTYCVNAEVSELIRKDPNILTEAFNGLTARYNSDWVNIRNSYINGAIQNYGKDENVKSKMDESITSTQETRKDYLQSLGGVTQ